MADQKNTPWTIPNILSIYRLCAAPVAIWAAVAGHRDLFAILVVVSLATDLVDGIIARAFNQSSRLGPVLDSRADDATMLAILTGVFAFEWGNIQADLPWVLAGLAAYAGSILVPLARFRKLAAFHLYLSKAVAFLVAIVVIWIFAIGYSHLAVRGLASAVVLAKLEVILVALLLPDIATDQKSVFHVLARRRRGKLNYTDPQPLKGAICMLNPAAGQMRDAATRARVTGALKARGVEILEMKPVSAGACGDIDANAISMVIACGGDGTIGAAVNAMDIEKQMLAVLPMGRGNCVSRDVGVTDVASALQALDKGRTCNFDLIEARYTKGGHHHRVLAAHAVAFGVLVDIIQAADAHPKLGAFAYTYGALISAPRPRVFDVRVDGTALEPALHMGVIALNTTHLSSHRPVTQASANDGLVELLLHPKGYLREKVMELATVSGLPALGMAVHRCRTAQITPPEPATLYVDGELIPDVETVTIKVLAGALMVICNDPGVA